MAEHIKDLWKRGNAASEADYERRLLLAYDIILSTPLPECDASITESTPDEKQPKQQDRIDGHVVTDRERAAMRAILDECDRRRAKVGQPDKTEGTEKEPLG